jgi:hypothetical protein
MPDDQFKIEITADASGVAAGAQQAEASLKKLSVAGVELSDETKKFAAAQEAAPLGIPPAGAEKSIGLTHEMRMAMRLLAHEAGISRMMMTAAFSPELLGLVALLAAIHLLKKAQEEHKKAVEDAGAAYDGIASKLAEISLSDGPLAKMRDAFKDMQEAIGAQAKEAKGELDAEKKAALEIGEAVLKKNIAEHPEQRAALEAAWKGQKESIELKFAQEEIANKDKHIAQMQGDYDQVIKNKVAAEQDAIEQAADYKHNIEVLKGEQKANKETLGEHQLRYDELRRMPEVALMPGEIEKEAAVIAKIQKRQQAVENELAKPSPADWAKELDTQAKSVMDKIMTEQVNNEASKKIIAYTAGVEAKTQPVVERNADMEELAKDQHEYAKIALRTMHSYGDNQQNIAELISLMDRMTQIANRHGISIVTLEQHITDLEGRVSTMPKR